MAIVYVNIGSNLGQREKLIETTIDKIAEVFGYYCTSEFVESEPWGFESTNSFLNIGMAFKTDLEPESVLDRLQEIERQVSEVAHRDSTGHYKDREIDIDIMAIDTLLYDSSRLSLPHKYLYERDFFLRPLNQLWPEGNYPRLR